MGFHSCIRLVPGEVIHSCRRWNLVESCTVMLEIWVSTSWEAGTQSGIWLELCKLNIFLHLWTSSRTNQAKPMLINRLAIAWHSALHLACQNLGTWRVGDTLIWSRQSYFLQERKIQRTTQVVYTMQGRLPSSCCLHSRFPAQNYSLLVCLTEMPMRRLKQEALMYRGTDRNQSLSSRAASLIKL